MEEVHGNQAPEAVEHDYAVMGDLGIEGLDRKQIRDGERRYIVRMFVGGIHPDAAAYDEEFTAHVEDLDVAIVKRMGELAKKPDKKAALPLAETDDHLTRTRQHPGHAVGVPGHWLSDERGQYESAETA